MKDEATCRHCGRLLIGKNYCLGGAKPDRHVSLFTEEQMMAAILADRARSAASPDVAKMVGEAKEILDETYRFAATSPRSQENINAVCELLDKIEAATIHEGLGEAAQAIQNALTQWDGEAGVWIQRRTAFAAIDALSAAATQARASAPESRADARKVARGCAEEGMSGFSQRDADPA